MACHTPNFPGLEQKYMFTLIFVFLVMYIQLYVESFIHPSCYWKITQKEEEKKKEEEICAYMLWTVGWPVEREDLRVRLSELNIPGNLQFTLALVFSLDEINRKPDLLPNISLLFDYVTISCNLVPQINKEAKTHIVVHDTINYMCDYMNRCYVFLSGPKWKKSLIIGKILDKWGVQQIVQLTFGPFHSSLNDHEQYPYLYQMAPKDTSLALAMVSLMLHFRWNWIGLAISDNDDGIQFLSYLRREMEQHILCLAFLNIIPVDTNLHMSRFERYSPILRKIQAANPAGETMNINHKEKLQAEYDIFQIWNFPNGVGLKVKIGELSPYFPHEQLHLYEDLIDWATGRGEMPTSVCSADCGPGFRKFRQEGMAVCCFDCSPCPENQVSNETNTDQCVKCPETHYANFEQNHCIHKEVIYLSYEDPLGMALTLIVLCFTLFTFVVFVVFVKYNDTPIVKANNRSLSYTLLVSLIFCFLCPLLFIGHPNTTTCILQQITFGVVFTVAVSTVSAKTITVLLAFKITVPGRRTRYYLISRAPNYIVVICIFIQIILCAIWLGVSPPFIDTDAHSEHGHIIILCDKGSVTAFYCVLGYHISLALVSFIVAFLVRNLPDTFNEAKLLTFSMLMFCSVWVTFLPVYHSTKGKVMVAVEVFSILASSEGLLGCIFFPKCYIILLRPERNSLPKLKEKSSLCN